MTFNIITLGCKVNSYESEVMHELLINNGYIYTDDNADIYIINTCSVTNQADSKSLKILRRIKREHPDSILVVCGCSSQNNQEKYLELGVNILLGNSGKSDIVSLLKKYKETNENYTYFTNERKLSFEDMRINKFSSHTRAFLKIEDGCDNFCSYCIIPYTRGSQRSKDFNKTIEEAKELVKNGHQEIVLTGIHTGSYSSNNHDLSDLIMELSKIEDLKRIRVSSIEITELNDKFIEVLKNNKKLCDHLHIPIQSGSEEVLKRMNRKYNKEYFKNKIEEIRRIRPSISITTDCIVGHPYEAEECFRECLSFCEGINFSKIHVFPYSIRSGTAASLMPQIDNGIKKERARKLIELSNKLEESYANTFLNKEVEVLTEEGYNGVTVGHTSNYLKIILKGDYKLNTNYLCKITKIDNLNIYGEVINCLNEEKIVI